MLAAFGSVAPAGVQHSRECLSMVQQAIDWLKASLGHAAEEHLVEGFAASKLSK